MLKAHYFLFTFLRLEGPLLWPSRNQQAEGGDSGGSNAFHTCGEQHISELVKSSLLLCSLLQLSRSKRGGVGEYCILHMWRVTHE